MNSETRIKQIAGYAEIQGETIAQFEFFDNGWNPYSRYLDVDKVDLILRRRNKDQIRYIEVQVKFGRLYDCIPKWQTKMFDKTSWRLFKPNEFTNCPKEMFLSYVLSHPSGYKGDIFIFPIRDFNHLISEAIPTNTKDGLKRRMYIAHSNSNNRWYLWKQPKFDALISKAVVDVTRYRRNFSLLN